MQKPQLKRLIDTGHYQPRPELIADAMLQRRGVRELLIGMPLSAADRIQSPPAARRQAA
jgi:hypothetical protein